MTSHAIVIVRDDADVEVAASIRGILGSVPGEHGVLLRVEECGRNGTECAAGICRGVRPDLTILVERDGTSGVAPSSAAWLKNPRPSGRILVVLPENRAAEAPQFLKAGASDFVLPPIRPRDLLPRVLNLLQPRESEDELMAHLKRVAGPRQIVGRSPLFMAELRKLPRIAGCDATALISGETGTGKELCARAVHYLSRRAGKPFVAVDCGAVPAELIENELFGHARGAYTSASTAQQGLIDTGQGGTLFLDETDALGLAMQSKLLRFLQEKEYRPLGSPRTVHADVRVIAASNISLADAVRAGRFRQDLFYRLNVLSLRIPPLRDRPEDIPLLARHFLEKYAAEFSRPARDLTDEVLGRLLNYPFPGNARELENLIARAVLACEGPRIDVRDIELPVAEPDHVRRCYQARKDLMIGNWEREELKRLLAIYRGNVSAIALAEGKDASALRALLRKHDLRPDRASPYWEVRSSRDGERKRTSSLTSL